jgi:hypothetical protein
MGGVDLEAARSACSLIAQLVPHQPVYPHGIVFTESYRVRALTGLSTMMNVLMLFSLLGRRWFFPPAGALW